MYLYSNVWQMHKYFSSMFLSVLLRKINATRAGKLPFCVDSTWVYLWKRVGIVLINFLLCFPCTGNRTWAGHMAMQYKGIFQSPLKLSMWLSSGQLSMQKWWEQLPRRTLVGKSALSFSFLWEYPRWTKQMRTTP